MCFVRPLEISIPCGKCWSWHHCVGRVSEWFEWLTSLGFDSQCPPLAYLPTHMLAICVLYLQTICCCFHTYTLTWICFVFSRFPWVEPPTRLLSKRRDINSSQHAEIGENWIFNLNFWLTRRCCFCCSAATSRWFNCVECLLWGEAITRGGNSLASPVREMTFSPIRGLPTRFGVGHPYWLVSSIAG